MTFKVTAPNKQYSGHGYSIDWRDGIGYTDDEGIVETLKLRGYSAETVGEPNITPQSIDPLIGKSEANDAAILGGDAAGPVSDAFLPPVGAGKGNDPHGTEVVSPGIHASETGPIVPGLVDDSQERKESKVKAEVFDGTDVGDVIEKVDSPADSRPKSTASKDDWVQYAQFLGVPESDLDGKKRAEIIELADKAENRIEAQDEKETEGEKEEVTEEGESNGEDQGA